MDINRNNYENYFLLYIDNELCPADKKAVEEFVHLHTDLQEELAMLQQTVIASEPVVFLQKESLLKIDEATQEKLLLHLDGELTTANAAAIQAEIANNIALQKEWAILQQTKLPAPTIVFEHKQDLLRKEPARIIPAKWWRAAAAVLIGVGLTGTLVLVTNKKTGVAGNDSGLAVKDNTINKTTTPVQAAPVAAPATGQAIVPAASTALQPTAPEKITAAVTDKKPGNSANSTTATNNESKVAVTQKSAATNEKSSIRERLENFNKELRNETIAANVLPAETISQPAATDPALTVPRQALAKANLEEALKENNAAYAVNTKNNNDITYDQLSADDKRMRRSGLVRKVSRFFQRSTKKKADGDGLKIAGFEFAVR